MCDNAVFANYTERWNAWLFRRRVLRVEHMLRPTLRRELALIVSVALLMSPCFAGVEIVEIGNAQIIKSLGGTVADPADSPLSNVQVVEVTPDWQTTIRSTTTDAKGRWSLPVVSGRRTYLLRFITKQCCFNEVRCRVKLNNRKGKELHITLPLST
jgi:hypothetical protein